jgi:hypothetical protein
MASHNYRIRIVRADQQFEAEGDKAFVLAMLERFEGGAVPKTSKSSKKSTKVSESSELITPHHDKALAVGEFIRQLGFKKHTDIVLAFGYFLETHSGLSDFTPADINTCYYDSKMEASNTSQMIIRNINQGRIMEAKKGKDQKKKSYVLTRTGEDFILTKMNKGQV